MRLERERWPLVWTTCPGAGVSLITIFDLAELRAVVDTDRVAAGLEPVAWVGRADDDPTFQAGVTPVRAVHFTQARAALAELYRATGLGPLPQFRAGPIAPLARRISLRDLLDLRAWVERYEQARPELAARVVRRFDAAGRLVEQYDGAGALQREYDRVGRLARALRLLDGRAYETRYLYDETDQLVGLTYPDGETIRWQWTETGAPRLLAASAGSALDERVDPSPSPEAVLTAARTRSGAESVRADGRGRPVLLGDPARPALRLAYDGDGRLVKRVDDRGTLHLVGPHYEQLLAPDGRTRAQKYVPDPAGRRWRLVQRPLPEGRAEQQRADVRLSEMLWARLEPVLAGEAGRAGPATAAWEQRQVLEGVLHVLRAGGDWAALPARFGPPELLQARFAAWRGNGVWERLLQAGLREELARQTIDWSRWTLDRPTVTG